MKHPIDRTIFTMSRLGSMGRWGNQILQYFGLREFAARNGLQFQCPTWYGAQVFDGIECIPVRAKTATYMEAYDLDGYPRVPERSDIAGHDFHGWAQWHTSWWHENGRVPPVFRLLPEWADRLKPLADTLRNTQSIGIHIRRGDYGQGLAWDKRTPVRWYLDWLEQNWADYDDPIVLVAAEDRALVSEFAAYNPHTVESLGVELQAAPYPIYNYLPEDVRSGQPHLLDFLPEWWAMACCTTLVAANSTFSFTAAMAGDVANFYRPDCKMQCFRRESVWNSWPLRRDCK